MELPSILLTLAKQPSFTTDCGHLVSIFQPGNIVLGSNSANDALKLLASPHNIITALITDPGVVSPAYASLAAILTMFIRAGGTLIVYNSFAAAAHDTNAHDLFKDFTSRHFSLRVDAGSCSDVVATKATNTPQSCVSQRERSYIYVKVPRNSASRVPCLQQRLIGRGFRQQHLLLCNQTRWTEEDNGCGSRMYRTRTNRLGWPSTN